ncbi:hypothetical protein F4810DRAFT_185818 [Camillea tinctor]|nr:hypothetical protein F4810DRAFT_185818 [Camillea tinctor]
MARQENSPFSDPSMEVDEVVEHILLRKDRQDILNRLFDEIHGVNILSMVESRSDSSTIYQRLCADVLQKLSEHFRVSLFATTNQTKQGGSSKEQIASVSRTLSKPNDTSNDISLLKLPSAADPIAKSDTHPSLGEYLTHSTTFEYGLSRLGIWVPTFITKDEICSVMPLVNELDVTERRKKMIAGLLDFSKLLNPFYLYFQARKMFSLMKEGKISVYREPRNIEDIIISWNRAVTSTEDHVLQAIISFRCFQKCKEHMKKLMEERKGLAGAGSLEESIEWSTCTTFAQMEKRMKQSERESKHASVSETKKWLHILKLGEGMSAMQEAFGGLNFLVLFPFYELTHHTKETFFNMYKFPYVWQALINIIQSTSLGEFFRSMAAEIGDALLKQLGGSDILAQNFGSLLSSHCIKHGLTPTVVHLRGLDRSYIIEHPEQSSLAFVQPLKPLRLDMNTTLLPKELIQFMGGNLGKDIVQYLIRRDLAGNWAIMGEDDIPKTANLKLTLEKHYGIQIPLFINNGWVLVQCVTSTIAQGKYSISFLDPAGGKDRLRTVLSLLSSCAIDRANIHEVHEVDCQAASEQDSGIHIILHAEAMRRNGKPETRQLNRQVCKALRIKYFVALLDAVYSAAYKKSQKDEGNK